MNISAADKAILELVPKVWMKNATVIAKLFYEEPVEVCMSSIRNACKMQGLELEPRHGLKEKYSSIHYIFSDQKEIVCCLLPKPVEKEQLYCAAYLISYCRDGSRQPELFSLTTDRGENMYLISRIDRHGAHQAMSMQTGDIESVAGTIYAHMSGTGKMKISEKKGYESSGEYYLAYIDYETMKGEIHEFGADGSTLRVTSGVFSSDGMPEKSPEEKAQEKLEEAKMAYRLGHAAMAEQLMLEAEKMGAAEGAFLAGMMNWYGVSGEKAPEKAFSQIKRAADAGYLPAMESLGVMYDYGLGTMADRVAAMSCYLSAINGDSDNPTVLNNFASCFAEGVSGQKDMDHAKRLFTQARTLGSEAAAKNLETLNVSYTEKEPVPEVKPEPIPTVKPEPVPVVKPESKPEPMPETHPETAKIISEDKVVFSPQNIEQELMQAISSSSSKPLGDAEKSGQWMLERIRYFRDNGVEAKKLYALVENLIKFIPEIYSRNFSELVKLFDNDLAFAFTPFFNSLYSKTYFESDTIGSPILNYILQHKEDYVSGRYYFPGYQKTLLELEAKSTEIFPNGEADGRIYNFLLAYAKNMHACADMWGNPLSGKALVCYEKSRQALIMVLELDPCDASAWMLLAEALPYSEAEEKERCIEKALEYCCCGYGPHGLAEFYAQAGNIYLCYNLEEKACVMYSLYKKLFDKNAGTAFSFDQQKHDRQMSMLLQYNPTFPSRKLREYLAEMNIEIGFSRKALFALALNNEPGKAVNTSDKINSIMLFQAACARLILEN